jgi:hypothetical protein
MKRPSFQFYPSDWLRDTALRTCSTGARGLWMDMICFMHEGNPYGYLKVGNKVILSKDLARMVGEDLRLVEEWLDELKEAGVYDIDDGAICSRRMIRDENLRKIRAEGGKLGGNPKLKDNHKDNLEVKQKTTPSSTSSSSSTTSIKDITPVGVSESIFKDYLEVRKAKKAKWTQTALKGLQREADKAKMSLQDVMQLCCERNWVGFKAEWANSQNPVSKQGDDKSWMFSNEGIVAKAKELGVSDYGIANYQQLKDKVLMVMTKKAMQ